MVGIDCVYDFRDPAQDLEHALEIALVPHLVDFAEPPMSIIVGIPQALVPCQES